MVWLATKTLEAIDAAICADGGNAFRALQAQVLPHMRDAYEPEDGSPRSHLGASVLGGPCERALFYSWRWASPARVSGKRGEPLTQSESRMRRLWNRGHLEEGRFISMLVAAGMTLQQQDANGRQFRMTHCGGHVGGSSDGVAFGVPDLPPGVPCLSEFKTHSDDSFKKLEDEGVKRSKPEHFVQMQTYMHGFGLLYALYLAVNKNTEKLYGEIVQFDSMVSSAFLDRARQIVFAQVAPERVRNASPGLWQCKYACDHTRVCYGTEQAQAGNCRTCAASIPLEDGTWACRRHGHLLDKRTQLAGCSDWQLWPELKA